MFLSKINASLLFCISVFQYYYEMFCMHSLQKFGGDLRYYKTS